MRQLLCILTAAFVSVTSAEVFAQQFASGADPVLALTSDVASASPTHRLTLDTRAGDLEAYRAILRYPTGFEIRPFEVGEAVGELTLDLNGDGSAEVRHLVVGTSLRKAYIDTARDQRYNAGLEPFIESSSSSVSVRLPYGGDFDEQTLLNPEDREVVLSLYPDVVKNPPQPGSYIVTATLVSVDPDTDGPDDAASSPPLIRQFQTTVNISTELIFAHGFE